MDSFGFFRDFGRIMWGPTLTLLAVRTLAAGVVWYIVLLIFGGPPGHPIPAPGNPLVFLFQWMIVAFIGLPIARLVFRIMGAITGGFGVLLGNLLSVLCSLALVAGDPVVFLLARRWPALAPVEEFKIVNFEPLIFVLRPADPTPVEVVRQRQVA